MNMLKKLGTKLNYYYIAFYAWLLFVLCKSEVAHADNIETTALYEGLKNLLTDVTKAGVGISIIITGCMVVFCLVMQTITGDEMESKKWSSRMKVALICGCAASVICGVITVLFKTYFPNTNTVQ